MQNIECAEQKLSYLKQKSKEVFFFGTPLKNKEEGKEFHK